jgi:hypothetical protein
MHLSLRNPGRFLGGGVAKLSIYCCLLILILAVTFGAPSAKADDITQVFNGYTFGATGQHTSTISGFLTLDTALLPSLSTRGSEVDPFSAFALTLTETDGTVITYDSLSTSLVLTPYGGTGGCGYLSGAPMSCQTLLEFGSGGNPNLELDMTITNYFDQQVGVNYDDTDSPFALGRAPIRGTFTETPEPGSMLLLGVGLLGLAVVSILRKS